MYLEMKSLARTLAVNSTLEELDISRNIIGDEGIGHIGTALLTNTSLKTLDISGCVPTVSSSLQCLDTSGNLMNGRVHICTALQKNATLKTLQFSNCGISDLVAESLARVLEFNSTLEELNISENEIGDNGIGHIGTALLTNTTLKILNIHKCVPSVPHLYTDVDTSSIHINGRVRICTALQTNTTLKKLKFSFCNISDLVAESLARALAVNSTLKELDISHNNIGDNGIGHIGTALLTNTTLKILNISKCVPAVSSSLQHLDTGGNHMNGRVHFFTALKKSTTLKILKCSYCGISDLVAESLARALAVNSSLKVLYIIDNNICDNGIDHIAKSLRKNNTLKFLCVGRMEQYSMGPVPAGFTDTGVLSLTRGVATNTSIECLCIQWHSTDPVSTLKKMAEYVKKSSPKTLSLYIWILDEALGASVSREKVSEWYHDIEVGGKELIMSLEDSHLESVQLIPFSLSHYEHLLQLQSTIDSVNSARHKKGLPNINFSIPSAI